MTAPFGQRLAGAVTARGPLCVGIDPHRELLLAWGAGDDLDGLRRFTDGVVEALAGSVSVLKPQMAFYERFGARGVAVLEEAVGHMRSAGALVLLDAKRGDIGSTMAAYADYLHDDHPMQVDAMTVSPYLGPDSLQPAVDTARAHGGGLFVLARTSNPDAGTLQHARVGDRSVAQAVVDTVGGWNAETPAAGSFGVVVGATLRELDVDLAGLGGPVLAPGLGVQGGSPADLRRLFAEGTVVVPTVSRDVLTAGPDPAALRAAAERWAGALAA
ncbi:orotidine-5'-phosphate decarboxylase [Blastococcus goldschmidtiae]|uniref:Orotidine 5'-phosphate decarboxylase n=1 Tax=Blastococcus goldschmidtiae TaxID=3075546 RepID=A0ABU2K9Z1_9ACTN|nr:orotidine-5'-phosphate decarboxylase [Blastococcus sp. DSM 46792]MDT0277016.1 orotidine-5'-phosphate decarboxylase [Blastococcus sp. DSM 46792]